MTSFLRNVIGVLAWAFVGVLLTACTDNESPMEPDVRVFDVYGFDKIRMGGDFMITVKPGTSYSVQADGDRQNLDALDIYVLDNTLVARYRYQTSRPYNTIFTITLPALRSVDFSGGTEASVIGFESGGLLDINLSGGASATLSVDYRSTQIVLSGASVLTMHGIGDTMTADLTGASDLNAYNYPVADVNVHASGASYGRFTISNKLTASASGASIVYYKGNPVVSSDVSGASKVVRE